MVAEWHIRTLCDSQAPCVPTQEQQAAILIAAVVDRFPGAIEDALSTVPKSAARYVRRALRALKRHLPASAQAAWDVLESSTVGFGPKHA